MFTKLQEITQMYAIHDFRNKKNMGEMKKWLSTMNSIETNPSC